ncbi:hypothetical protein C8Q73DRAFT_326703 [Cubamyces lactineus]|nr:hypothetical protein C8Q73DRAFT_326703 [Cubamyces lactineus]
MQSRSSSSTSFLHIWYKIFILACTDGGFTGRSLALTSTFFYSQSLSTRYYSLAFHSLVQLEAFTAFLQTRSEDYRPRIDHLYLGFANEPIKIPEVPWSTFIHLTDEEQEQYRERVKQRKLDWETRFHAASATLLPRVAPTLRALCIIQEGSFLLPFEFPCVFPQLKELTWTGNISAFEAENLKNAGREPTKLPALPGFAAPSLTHLRLSNMDVDGENGTDISPMVADLLNYLIVDPYLVFAHETHSCRKNLPILERFIIHYKEYAVHNWYEPSDLAYRRMSNLALACSRCDDGLSMLVLRRGYSRRVNPDWPARLLHEWKDRICGGRGCWVEDEQQEVELEAPFEVKTSDS